MGSRWPVFGTPIRVHPLELFNLDDNIFNLVFFPFSALFLIEAGNEKLWLWQGWWPDVGHEANDTNMSTGSGIIRWHAERREAMRTVKEFQRSKFSKLTNQARPPMELVWAGHEPLEFTNLFPSWTHHIDIQTLNYKVSQTSYYFVQNTGSSTTK